MNSCVISRRRRHAGAYKPPGLRVGACEISECTGRRAKRRFGVNASSGHDQTKSQRETLATILASADFAQTWP